LEWQNGVMFIVGGILITLAIRKNFEPLLLVPSALEQSWQTYRVQKWWQTIKTCIQWTQKTNGHYLPSFTITR
jgi:hypothetical protein